MFFVFLMPKIAVADGTRGADGTVRGDGMAVADAQQLLV